MDTATSLPPATVTPGANAQAAAKTSTASQLLSLNRYFSGFLKSLTPKGRGELGIPDGAATLHDAVTGGEVEAYDLAVAYLRSYLIVAEGTSDDRVTASTLRGQTQLYFMACRMALGEPIGSEVTRKVRQCVDRSLIPEFGLSEEKRPPTWTDDDVVGHVVATGFSEGVFEANTRRRIETLAYVASSFSSAQRVSELVGKEVKAGADPGIFQRLVWGRMTIVVARAAEGSSNEVCFRVPLTASKDATDESKHREFGFLEGPLRRSPAFAFLVLAVLDSALPEGWDVARLFDPASVPPGPTRLELAMRPAASDTPVFRTRDNNAWTPHTARYSLKAVSRAAGLNFALLPHAIRRSVAVADTLNGDDDHAIQDKLLHRWSDKKLDDYRGFVVPVDVTAAVYGGEDGLAEVNKLHPSYIRPVTKGTLSARRRAEILEGETLTAMLAEHEQLVANLLAEHGVEKLGDLPLEARNELQCSHVLYSKTYRALVAAEIDAEDEKKALLPTDGTVDPESTTYFPSFEEASGSLPSAVEAIDVDSMSVVAEVAAAGDDDDLYNAAVSATLAGTVRRGPDDGGMDQVFAQAIKDAEGGHEAVASITSLNSVKGLLVQPREVVDVPEAVQRCADLVATYRSGFRAGHGFLNGRCRTCARTVDEVLHLRESSVHKRVTASEPEVVADPPLPTHRLRHLRSHVIRCAERAAIRTQAPAIMQRLSKTVPAQMLSPKGSELPAHRCPEALRRLYGDDFQGERFREVKCLKCDGQPVLATKELAMSHVLLEHNVFMPYSPPPAGIEPWSAEGLGFEAVWDEETLAYVVDPRDQHFLAVRTLPRRLRPDHPGPFGVHPDIIVSDDEGVKGPGKVGHDTALLGDAGDEGICLLCATNPLLPPTAQARWFKDLRSHYAKCLKDHLRLSIDLLIDPHAHDAQFVTTHLWSDGGLVCPHPVCLSASDPEPATLDLLGLVWHLALKHDFFFGGVNEDMAGSWRPTPDNPVKIDDVSFRTEKQLRRWATTVPIPNTLHAPDLAGRAIIDAPELDGPLTIPFPLDVNEPSKPVTVFKKLEPWRQANPPRR